LEIGSLPAGAAVTALIRATVKCGVKLDSDITNIAEVHSSTPDENSENNRSKVTVSVQKRYRTIKRKK
jgi:hypothetical protein